MASESSPKTRPPIISLSLFTQFSETFSADHGSSKSQNSATDFKPQMKSPRNFEGGVVGLGIVAAMNEMNDTHEAFTSAKPNRSAQIVLSPRSKPIAIAFGKPAGKFWEPFTDNDVMEQLSESYTCVISRIGNNSIVKREYFDKPDGSSVFISSPPKYPEMENPFQAADFLNSCYLCKKKLQGLDIFMYKGDKAFCSAECRCKQIFDDEHKEKSGSGTLKKSCDYSVSPCSASRLFSAGVAAA